MFTKSFDLSGVKLTWIFSDSNNAADLPDNNLFIEGLWNMKDTVGHDDCCTVVEVLSPSSFAFTVFSGQSYTMLITDGKVVLSEKRFVH